MSTPTNLEVEIKLALLNDLPAIHLILRAAQLQVTKPRIFETNVVLDTPDLALRKNRELIRIRRVGADNILTYKGPPQPGEHKTREEIETAIAHPAQLELIFLRLGYRPTFRYEKFRTEFGYPGQPGVVTLDETPIGNFLEIEGDPLWIDHLAHALGFSKAAYLTQSYATLYRAYCEKLGLPPTNMVFTNPAAS